MYLTQLLFQCYQNRTQTSLKCEGFSGPASARHPALGTEQRLGYSSNEVGVRRQEKLSLQGEALSLLSGNRLSTTISSVIELCALDWRIFFVCYFLKDFFKNKETER